MRTRTACGTVQYDLPHGGLLISRVGALQLPSGTIVSGQVPAPPLLCDTLSATMSRALGVLLLRLCAAETKNEEPEFAQLHKKVAVAMWSDRVDESNAVVRANKLYARRHGYSFLLDRHRQFPAWTPHWERIPLIASLLQTHSIVAWLDDDAFVEQQHVLVESWFEEQCSTPFGRQYSSRLHQYRSNADSEQYLEPQFLFHDDDSLQSSGLFSAKSVLLGSGLCEVAFDRSR